MTYQAVHDAAWSDRMNGLLVYFRRINAMHDLGLADGFAKYVDLKPEDRCAVDALVAIERDE